MVACIHFHSGLLFLNVVLHRCPFQSFPFKVLLFEIPPGGIYCFKRCFQHFRSYWSHQSSWATHFSNLIFSTLRPGAMALEDPTFRITAETTISMINALTHKKRFGHIIWYRRVRWLWDLLFAVWNPNSLLNAGWGNWLGCVLGLNDQLLLPLEFRGNPSSILPPHLYHPSTHPPIHSPMVWSARAD